MATLRMLAEAAALGWPVGLALAAVVAGDRVRETRRRAALNRALHELRRPLHALALGPVYPPPAAGSVDLALAALGDLDREINRAPQPLARRPVACRALVEATTERWRGPAARARRSLELRWRAGSPIVIVDPRRIEQALDNLIANSLEHGGLRVRLDAAICARGVRIAVADSGRGPAARGRRDPRRGHGLRVVAEVAAEHGGRFVLERSSGGTVAVLELPLAPAPLPAELIARARAAAA